MNRCIEELNSIIIGVAGKMADEAMQELPSRDKLREYAAVIRNARERIYEYHRYQGEVVRAKAKMIAQEIEARRRAWHD